MRNKVISATSAIALMMSLAACGTPNTIVSNTEPVIHRDLAYGEGARHQLDLYLPSDPSGAPVVVFIHGGRWFRNDKAQIELYGRVEALLSAGYVIAAINHTYSSEALWPAQLNDVLNAISFIQEEAGQYGYDSDKLAIWGQSSGAHLTLMSGLELSKTAPGRVDALISWYAPTDLYSIRDDRIQDNVPGENERFKEPSPETLLLGRSIDENKNNADLASPVFKLKSLDEAVELPPILLVHGTQDFVISPLQSERFYEAVNARPQKTDVNIRYVIDGKHGGNGFADEVQPVIDFLDDHLKN